MVAFTRLAEDRSVNIPAWMGAEPAKPLLEQALLGETDIFYQSHGPWWVVRSLGVSTTPMGTQAAGLSRLYILKARTVS